MPENSLNLWRFDASDWRVHPDKAPLVTQGVAEVESWSGYAVGLSGINPALLAFPATTSSGHVHLSADAGTIRFWFRPYWGSHDAGGQGYGQPVTLTEIGAWSKNGAMGAYSLWVTPDGGTLRLSGGWQQGFAVSNHPGGHRPGAQSLGDQGAAGDLQRAG